VSTNGAANAAEPANAPGDLNGLEATLKAAAAERKGAAKAAPKAADTGNEVKTAERPEYIPEKFWTGNEQESLTKMAASYQNLESAYGRMANDLGVQRKLTDRMLALDKRDQDINGTQAPKAPKVDPRRLVDNPTETLDEYWKTRESELRNGWEAEQQQRDQKAREQAFVAKHPDFGTTAQSPEFLAWVNADPFRARVAALAGTGDFTSADDLLTQYKATKKAPAQDANLEAARRAGTESAANASESGNNGKGSKRVYRRADLIQMKMDKPEVYGDPVFQAEIYQAYQEGRVK
jgi:hypothetical protein